jgi:hypothetical protein
MKRRVSATTRLMHELFTQYPSTFRAFCELINNSIQAKAKKIDITIDYAREGEMFPTAIKQIVIKDDGVGVHLNDVQEKLLDFGDSSKKGGKGVGRFGALQIGSDIEIESVGFDQSSASFSKVKLPFKEQYIKSVKKVEQLEIETEENILKGAAHKTYYQVLIKDIYDANVTGRNQKRRISEKLLQDNIFNSIFERYPLLIFNKTIRFTVNGKYLDPKDFIDGTPENIIHKYKDKKGVEHPIYFSFIKLKSTIEEIKVFLTAKNADIDTIIGGFEFEADWLGPKSKGWFVYVTAETLQTDIYRTSELDEMDEEAKAFRAFIKEKLNVFYKAKNKKYEQFIEKLHKDNSYPYNAIDMPTSKSQVTLFEKLAFLVEEKYSLINGKNKLREIIYPLIDRTILTGELDKVLQKVLKLDSKNVKRFNDLLDRSDMEDLIEFSEKVSKKIEDLAFLEKLAYSEISKHVRERTELHKVLEKMLWVFGEQYLDNTRLLSDKNLENNLKELREKTMVYKKAAKDDNVNIVDSKIKGITDLFLYSEKPIDESRREVLIVELKAPKVKVSSTELQQAMRYAEQIESSPFYTSDISFHIILISSELSKTASYQIDPVAKPRDNPFFFFQNAEKNITISVMKWANLIEVNKRKLRYMSTQLKVKDVNVEEKIKKDFDEIGFEKVHSTLRKVNMVNS